MDAPHKVRGRWMWIELIGFDNLQPDYGVGDFFKLAGFTPGALSLLMNDPDFIHLHERDFNRFGNVPFLPSFCSYGTHPFNEERQRQDWTPDQLKGLIKALHQHGVEVYFNVFDTCINKTFYNRHQPVLHMNRHGERVHSICPWKHIKPGLLYEDFLLEKLIPLLQDYSFDGFHLADGYGHPRIPVYDGDFSDDMVTQFLQTADFSLPSDISGVCDNDAELIKKRAGWIWQQHRRKWIDFYAGRIAAFVRKITEALHAHGKKVTVNTVWTRDPFEALYRYGTDYQRLAQMGIDSFIAGGAAACMEMDDNEMWGKRRSRYLDCFTAALMLTRAYAPQTPLRYLNGIKDIYEQYQTLRHAPMSLQSEIFNMSNVFFVSSERNLQRCFSGPVACLADSIRASEWDWLRKHWELAGGFEPVSVLGATLLWSDKAFRRQLDDFIATRRWSTHRLLLYLLTHGAGLHKIARIEDLNVLRGALVILNAHTWPEDELASVMNYRSGPVIMIGGRPDNLSTADLVFEDVYPPHAQTCLCYRPPRPWPVSIMLDEQEPFPADITGIEDPPYFPQELKFRPVSESFLQNCAGLINACSHKITIKTSGLYGAPTRGSDFISVMAQQNARGIIRLFIRNDKHVYQSPVVELGRPIKSVRVVTSFPLMPIVPDGSRFRVKVPGRGMTVLDVEMG